MRARCLQLRVSRVNVSLTGPLGALEHLTEWQGQAGSCVTDDPGLFTNISALHMSVHRFLAVHGVQPA